MFTLRGVKNILMPIAAFCSIELAAQNTSVNFDNHEWKILPKDSTVQIEEDKTLTSSKASYGKITIPDAAAEYSIYTYIPVKGNETYKISFQYKLKDFKSTNSDSIQVKLHFNNGKKGAGKFPLNPDTDEKGWQQFSTEALAPAGTESCQFIISFSGIKGTLWVGNLEVRAVNDTFIIEKTDSPPIIDGKLDDECWKKAVPIFPFYVSNNISKQLKNPSEAFISYDDNNIYIAFKNTEHETNKITANSKERDGSVWNDDCDEIYIAAPNEKVFQFIVNSINTQWDGSLYIKIPGDPYKADAAWNGTWTSAVSKGKDSWVTEFAIPFSNFQIEPEKNAKWYINLARENKVSQELSHFNRVMDVFNNAAKFASLEFSGSTATLKRYSETELADPFKIKRKSPKFNQLLLSEPGKYLSGTWGKECVFDYCPPEIRKKYTPETFSKEQDTILSEFGKAGLLGPVAFPWAPTRLGMKKIKEYYEKYGTKYWFMLSNSSLERKAVEEGAVYVSEKGDAGNGVNVCDPVYQKVIENFAKEYFSENQDKAPYLQFILGKDEPTNSIFPVFSMTVNEKHRDALEELDKKIKKDFGFGKYGIYDDSAEKNASSPFCIIAFMNWWNNTFAGFIEKQQKMLKKYAPGIQYIAYNKNCCSGYEKEDASLLAPYTDWVSGDPYPTSAMYNFTRNRSVYHTGFSIKLLKDVSGGKPTCAMLQGFPYCGRTPSPDNMREWASQALKNGAELIFWFTSGAGPIRITLPEIYKEKLRLSGIIHNMKKLPVPTETVTAVFLSNSSRWGNFDKPIHSYYTVYSILGEQLKTWFRFISDSGLKLKLDDISRYKTVYVPQLTYCDEATAETLLNYVRNGGRLIILDPEAFTWNIDGTPLDKIRNELIGCNPGKILDVKNLIVSADYSGLKKGDELPLTPLTHRTGAGRIQAFEITPPSDAKIIANYPDGKAAAFERNLGKGSIIYFAAQPFGNSDLAVKDSKWSAFMKGIAEQTGEKLELPIWDFELPAKGGEIEVKYVIKPDTK